MFSQFFFLDEREREYLEGHKLRTNEEVGKMAVAHITGISDTRFAFQLAEFGIYMFRLGRDMDYGPHEFKKDDVCYAVVDDHIIKCRYNELDADGFHWVFTFAAPNLPFRLAESEIKRLV